MSNIVTPTSRFIKNAKRLLKKFPTLQDSLYKMEEELIRNPYSGSKLNQNIYKIRLADKSKGKGKSGGFRIISYLVRQTENSIEILLLTIYDKSEQDMISSSEIKQLVNEVLVSRPSKP